MKRQTTSSPDPDEQKRIKSDASINTANRTATGGKHPISPGGKPMPPTTQQQRSNTVGKQQQTVPGVGGKQPPPGVGGKQPPPGVGGKHPTVGGKQPITAPRGGKEPAGTGGKQPTSTPGTAQRPSPQQQQQRPTGPPRSQSQTTTQRTQPPPGVGGKQPIAYQQLLPETETKQTKPTKTKQQNSKPPVSQTTSTNPSPTARPRGRPPSNQSPRQPQKVHPYVGKRVKVYYIDEGYHTGTVKSVNENTREFIIHWDEGSTSGVTLNEDDETEDPENDDRWSVVEDDRITGNGVQKGVRGGVRGKVLRGGGSSGGGGGGGVGQHQQQQQHHLQLPVGEDDDSDS